MSMIVARAARAALLCGAALCPLSALHAEDAAVAADAADTGRDILVVAQRQADSIENAPATRVSLSAEEIAAKVNAVNVEDTLKYLPSIIVRKRHIGDNFAPIATRTSGLGSSARSLIFADGVPLSALINNNNGNGSPRWFMVTPEEVASVDVLYGPFSAAYAGNSIGGVVNITTRLPDQLEAQMSVLTGLQWHSQYKTSVRAPSGQFAGSIGDRFGRLSLLLSATRTVSNSQPISYVTSATPTVGAVKTRNRTDSADVYVLGAGGIEHHVQDVVKLKAAYDLTDSIRAIYVVSLFQDDTQGNAETYLNAPMSGAFSSGIYTRDIQHWAHALSLNGSADKLDWQVVGSLYDYAHDIQRSPSTAAAPSLTGGAGSAVRQDGTGWYSVDAKAAWKGAPGHVLSLGAHIDQYKLNANTYATPDWTSEAQGAVTATSRGKTRTIGLWAQDAWQVVPSVTVTLGGRYEWWRAFDGFNLTSTGTLNQPERTAEGFSPKASIEWRPAAHWSLRLSGGQAFRFPTVGELYLATQVGAVLATPNPNLRPERARSFELAVQHATAKGSARLSLFSETVKDALISQLGSVTVGNAPPVSANFVQNIERTRVRGVELALDQRDLLPRIDLSGSVTWTDAKTVANPGFAASVGKRLPSVPEWKATAVLTWRPTDRLSFSSALRYSSRNYAALDNTDVFPDTYQGFDKFLVVDLRARAQVTERVSVAVGIDNVNDDRYFLFHPFPRRSATAQLSWKL